MPKKPVKTAVNDLLDWIDRVESRDIKSLSTDKIRERIKERLPLEKERIIRFAKVAVSMEESSWNDIYEEVFGKQEIDETI
tara:strand:- start:25902 stop:26144 length:243 start_codon:yes stop_codon:yes gene_type:complete